MSPRTAQAETQRLDEGDVAYARDRVIREASQLVSHPSHVVAGALASAPDAQSHFTVQEVKALVASFLRREVEAE